MNNPADSDSADTDHACVVDVDVDVGVGVGAAASSSSNSVNRTRNPRKKRTKLMTIMEDENEDIDEGVKRKASSSYKRPDPNAPKITRPCTECGKKFWSWKALFGHMRCHPERQWRGINPPPDLLNLRRQQQPAEQQQHVVVGGGGGGGMMMNILMTEEDHEVAACLLLLASGSGRVAHVECGMSDEERFECSSCKKVFGSHQALGGHRASHKNVKGCFAITTATTATDHPSTSSSSATPGPHDHLNILIHDDSGGGHKCGICLRVFSTGQALGGHKRCHWEKADADHPSSKDGCLLPPLDLNLPPPPPPPPHDDDHLQHQQHATLTLDLRLGL